MSSRYGRNAKRKAQALLLQETRRADILASQLAKAYDESIKARFLYNELVNSILYHLGKLHPLVSTAQSEDYGPTMRLMPQVKNDISSLPDGVHPICLDKLELLSNADEKDCLYFRIRIPASGAIAAYYITRNSLAQMPTHTRIVRELSAEIAKELTHHLIKGA
jgi:hypothetical protein